MAPPKVLKRFSPPAFLTDLTSETLLQGWSDTLSGWMQGEIARGANGGGANSRPLKQFFDGTKTAFDQEADPVHITWPGFPRLVKGDDETRWKSADASRDVQDEYLEWSILRDTNSNIQSVTYTCEGPEYWEYIGFNQPDQTFALIKKLNAPMLDSSKMEDFFTKQGDKWQYNRGNQFNNNTTSGIIISLFQPNNTLSAEVDIAAQATVIRKQNGKVIGDDFDTLIKCSQYGDPGRNSDPKIGGEINAAARKGFSVSVADPVALYIQSFDTSNLLLDTSGDRSGSNKQPIPDSWISVDRGSGLGSRTPLCLRLRVRNANGAKTDDGSRLLDVSDIWDDSKQTNIRYGAQFADLIQMGVAGVLGPKLAVPTVDQALPCAGSSATAEATSTEKVAGGEGKTLIAAAHVGQGPHMLDSLRHIQKR